MVRKNVYISYDYANDKHYKYLLTEWDKAGLFNFSFYDRPKGLLINEYEAMQVKATVSKKIAKARYFLCIVGANSLQNHWVKWEVNKAFELERKVIAVKTEPFNLRPEILGESKVNWGYSFSFDSISKAIKNY